MVEGDGEKILARVSITLYEMIAIHGLAVMPGRDGGLYLAFPTHKHSDGSSKDTAHPINKETREYIQKSIFELYKSGKIEKRSGTPNGVK